VLDPTYRVPTLYIHVVDAMKRYPPTMATLYSHIISPQYATETKDVGVLGGVTVIVSPPSPLPLSLVFDQFNAHPPLSPQVAHPTCHPRWRYRFLFA
jgi:hypothetical protein